ncbi:DUF3099 family protein [Actinomycetospora succinea]|uniref:DUF3099 family protein n=1 Tax=Actinomycetospora succinea TaxID=663603 RepID=A0A4R6VR49_9PSEU|nr:DUF3099 domain-containing protein [Actinomycetospora succinea]TDQ65841.1 DUF3099 family protein [Actinomycetospora succinea]
MVNRRQDDDGQPILITQAAISYDEEFAARKKRYSLIMACRIPCLVLAGVAGIGFNLPWVAVAFIVLSVPLPWVAVLIANDRPPKKAEKANRYRRSHQELGAVPEAQIIEAAEALERRDQRTESPRQPQQDAAEHAPPRTGTEG